jgi:lipooligosaccharide transport system ATP-binding protein
MSSDTLIEAQNLTKKYDDFIAVDTTAFQICKGECVGFLGPNGAGKTASIKMIHRVLPPFSGSLTIAGMSMSSKPREIKKMIGVEPRPKKLMMREKSGVH